jgi:hypothetical protein
MRNDLGKKLNTSPCEVFIILTAHTIPSAVRRGTKK